MRAALATKNTNIHLVKSLDVTDLAGEKVMIDFGTGKYFLLKGPANEIWDIINEKENVTVEEIVNHLMEIFEVDYETCYQSVVEFITQIESYEFVSLDN